MRWYRWNGLEQYTWAQNKSQLLFKFGVAGLVTGRGGRRGRLRKRWGWGGGHGAVLESPFNSCWEVRPFLPRGNKCIWGAKEKPWSQKAWANALLKEPAFGEPHPVPAMDREGQAENPDTWPWTQALWGRYGPAASLLWVCAFNWERFFQWLNTMREFRCLLLSTQHKSIGSILTGAFPHVPQIVLECNSFSYPLVTWVTELKFCNNPLECNRTVTPLSKPSQGFLFIEISGLARCTSLCIHLPYLEPHFGGKVLYCGASSCRRSSVTPPTFHTNHSDFNLIRWNMPISTSLGEERWQIAQVMPECGMFLNSETMDLEIHQQCSHHLHELH